MSKETIEQHGPACAGRTGLGGTLELSVRREQRIADVPFPDPCLILVTRGRKTLSVGDQRLSAGPGQLLFVNGGVSASMCNAPEPGGVYAATCVAVAPELVRAHAIARGALPATPWRALAQAPMDSPLAEAVRHVAAGMLAEPPLSDRLLRHRLAEILIALDDLGCWCRIGTVAGAAERVRALLSSAPAEPWSARDVATRLHMSEATLRRLLRAEGAGFRELLNEVRMGTALAMIQGTTMPLQVIANACGYASPSRFAARFKARFGTAPSDLRR
ncbi:helix-turn-helix domain-containing protein [Nitrogeniibacter mangrovi]|uniref:Helix-turn-helix domain-containing protein n=1 Tax=Nitrogeniibacter mangrovi TaxID=2016596 RepID=A0A6C1B2E9_9RHOO|nr:helix-turn-helix domain-containing protein [Nitrogeniibacter mangrovi]QID16520.1 helix-turn-helix domain-containing protein [Nitrogeniibacter mangrovi]